MKDRQTIFVSAYPKSGSTWCTRLLADVLNSPSGGCMPEEDAKEVATEGQDRPGAYVVRKGHFTLIEDNGPGPVVPRPHRLAWQRLTDERILLLVRDPRDICISGAWHWRQTPEQFLERMIRGDVARCGRWDEFISKWAHYNHDICSVTKFELLLRFPWTETVHILSNIEASDGIDGLQILEAIQRQSFASRQAQIGDNPAELRRNNMRKGIVGDWRNHFTPAMNERIWGEFGWMMEGLGYERNQELPLSILQKKGR